MGTLGTYLVEAREKLGIDLYDAAQQTRISIHYLKALEQEDFSRLPGEVFVKGFLRNYARFLNLPESEVLHRYSEIRRLKPPAQAVEQPQGTVAPACEKTRMAETPLEPIIWGAVIFVSFIVLFFASMPQQHKKPGVSAGQIETVANPDIRNIPVDAGQTNRLYLEVSAIEDTWVLVRTDSSPQKKAVLKKGESVTWSATERFLLSYGGIGTLRLVLNGMELTANGPKGAVVRDMMITSSGIVSQNIQQSQPLPARPKPPAVQDTVSTPSTPSTPEPQPAEPEQLHPTSWM